MKKIYFAENLKWLRKSKKLSQAELGNLIGVDQRAVSAWESGIREPSYETLAILCELFDETFDSILT